MNPNKTIKLKSGKEVEYKTNFTAGLFLDLNDIPVNKAGTRLRTVANGLVVRINDQRNPGQIKLEIEALSVGELGELSVALTEVIEAEVPGEKNTEEKKN
jgi:hypothetical protein